MLEIWLPEVHLRETPCQGPMHPWDESEQMLWTPRANSKKKKSWKYGSLISQLLVQMKIRATVPSIQFNCLIASVALSSHIYMSIN